MTNVINLEEYRKKKEQREHVTAFIEQMQSIYELSCNTVWHDGDDDIEDCVKDDHE